jgi:hypothetical protein
MLDIARAIFAGVMLFLGRDVDWLFALGMGLLVGLKMTTLLTVGSPLWMFLLLILAMGAISILPHLVYPESKYIMTGFLFGGYLLSEYGNTVIGAFRGTGLSGSTWMIFFVGAVVGATILAFTKEWGVMFATALVGGFIMSSQFNNLDALTQTLLASGLFIVGGIVQAIIMRVEKSAER